MSGWSQLEHDAVDRLSAMGPMEIAVYVALLRHCDQHRKCFPSMAKIAVAAGIKERRARMAVSNLIDSGLMSRQMRIGKNGAMVSPTYHLPLLTPQDRAAHNAGSACDARGPGIKRQGAPAQNATLTITNITRTKEQGARTFIKPSLEQVQAYCRERKNRINPQQFTDHYESNGWRVGKNPMRDWKAAVRTWERNGFSNGETKKPSESIKYRA